MPPQNLDLELLGTCNSEPLKKLKSSPIQMFSKQGVLNISQYS